MHNLLYGGGAIIANAALSAVKMQATFIAFDRKICYNSPIVKNSRFLKDNRIKGVKNEKSSLPFIIFNFHS